MTRAELKDKVNSGAVIPQTWRFDENGIPHAIHLDRNIVNSGAVPEPAKPIKGLVGNLPEMSG